MSPSRSASALDRDIVMGPPPLPPLSTPAQQPHKDDQYIGEKYRKLKRRYFDLEEVNFYAANLNTH